MSSENAENRVPSERIGHAEMLHTIQQAIGEWASIAGGPGYDRSGQPTLAEYIASALPDQWGAD